MESAFTALDAHYFQIIPFFAGLFAERKIKKMMKGTVGEELTGFYSMEVVISTPVRWTNPEMWPPLDGLSRSIDRSPAVARVLSPLDLLRKLRHWESGFDPEEYRLTETASEAERLIAGVDERGASRVGRVVSDDGHTVRLSVIVDEMDEARRLHGKLFAGQLSGKRRAKKYEFTGLFEVW